MDKNTILTETSVRFNAFPNTYIELYENDGPKIKVFKDDKDVTKDIFGITNIYGSIQMLLKVYETLFTIRSTF